MTSQPPATDPTTPFVIRVADAPRASRFQATIDGELAGFVAYVRQPDRVVLTHTEVAPAFEGRGVGSALAKGALDAVRAERGRVEARCPFIATYVRRHAEFRDLLVMPGTGSESDQGPSA